VTFPRRLLTEGEEVVVELRPHWAFLGWPLVATLAAAALAVALDVAFSPLPATVGDVLLGVVAVAALWLAGRALRWISTSLVLTSTRIVERSGVLGRRALEIRLDRINELSYHQSLGARLVRSGELMVETGGESGDIIFDHVPRPPAFQSLVTEQISALRDGRRVHYGSAPGPDSAGALYSADTPPTGAPVVPRDHPPPGAQSGGPLPPASPPAGSPPSAAAPGTGPTVADRLIQLGELRRRGIVSAAEFEAKKAQLLEQL
jgi:hypothetical protein